MKNYNVTLSTGAIYHITLQPPAVKDFEEWLLYESIYQNDKWDIMEWLPGFWINRKYIVSVVVCDGVPQAISRGKTDV